MRLVTGDPYAVLRDQTQFEIVDGTGLALARATPIGDDPTVSPLFKPWSVRARNLPEHSTNAIHTDERARRPGSPARWSVG